MLSLKKFGRLTSAKEVLSDNKHVIKKNVMRLILLFYF